MRHSTPVITCLQSTLGGINDHFVIYVLQIPFSGQLYEPIKISFFELWIKSSFVQGIQVMNNMHKLCSIEDFFILINFDISTDKATHPIVRDDHWREYLELAEGFQCNQGQEDHLFCNKCGSFSVIWSRKEFRIMEPNIVYAFIVATMDSKFILKVGLVDLNVPVMCEPISGKVTSLLLLVVFVVRRQ